MVLLLVVPSVLFLFDLFIDSHEVMLKVKSANFESFSEHVRVACIGSFSCLLHTNYSPPIFNHVLLFCHDGLLQA